MPLYEKMQELLDNNQSMHQLRQIIAKEQNAEKILVDGKSYINLSSNDYLGLASNQAIAQEFLSQDYVKNLRQSSSGSPLLTGAHLSYQSLEQTIDRLYHKHAVFFNSGFAANSGVLASLGTKENLILADKLAHASMIDGITQAKGKFLRFRHNDYEHLESLIAENSSKYDSIIVVTEAVFSMDGDKCDLKKLVELKRKYQNVYLYVDEAHSFCVFDSLGLGLSASCNYLKDIDFIILTFGKGLGSQGAAILCNQIAKDYIINTTRSLIFSTALSPFAFAHANFMLNYMSEHNELRQRLAHISNYIQECLIENNFVNLSASHIIPLLTYSNEKALLACSYFREQGFYAMPIRHPTVPLNQARLRISLSAALSDAEVERLGITIKNFSKLKD